LKRIPIFSAPFGRTIKTQLEFTESPKFNPRTKHIALKYPHFRQSISDGILKNNPIDTLEQTADIFTKSLDQEKFKYLQKELCGW